MSSMVFASSQSKKEFRVLLPMCFEVCMISWIPVFSIVRVV